MKFLRKFLNWMFPKKEETVEVPVDPVDKKLQRERFKRRKAMRKNKHARRLYREAHDGWVVPKPRKKAYNKPQNGNNSYYRWR